ncbi:MAG: tetratricopeptide repeat protein [Planctomycetota bacterium]
MKRCFAEWLLVYSLTLITMGVAPGQGRACGGGAEGGGGKNEDADQVEPTPDNLQIPEDWAPDVRAGFEQALVAYRNAHVSRQKDDIRKAIAVMEATKQSVGASALPHFYIGMLQLDQREFGKARAALTKATGILPALHEAHTALGDTWFREHKPEKSIPHYQRALELAPRSLNAVYQGSIALIQTGRFDEARGYVDRALAIWQEDRLLKVSAELDLLTKGPKWDKTYTVETKNYFLRTDVSQEFAERAGETAELIREVYDAAFPDLAQPDRKYCVLIYRELADYMRDGAPDGTAGFYDPLFKHLNVSWRGNEEETLMVLKHEGFHQYCHQYLEDIPQWFNEGLAEYFAASKITVKKNKRLIEMGPHPWRLHSIATAIEANQYPTIKELMHMSQTEMYEPSKMQLHYSQAWSICNFCADGADGKYRPTMRKYFKSLIGGKSQAEAFDNSFGKVNMSAFENEWREYVLKMWKTESRR